MTKNNLQDDDICPVNDSGNHRYFIFKTFEVYEPYKLPGAVATPLYEKVEYAISGCNCGSAIRQKVRQA